MASAICVIATSPTVEKEVVAKIKTALPESITVREEIYLQATAGIPLEVIEVVFVFVASLLGKGFLEELGKDSYGKLKGVLKDLFAKNGERTLAIEFKSKRTKVSFRLETDDPSVVDSALSKVPDIISKTDKSASFFLGPHGNWEEFEGEVEFAGVGVAATTEEFEINGRKVRIPERALRKWAENMRPDLPILYQHRGRPIGKLTDSWVKGGKLYVRLELYKPRNEMERQIVETIKSGNLRGLSMGFSFSEESEASSPRQGEHPAAKESS